MKFAANRFYQQWDQRIFSKWNEHALRELPTEEHPLSTQSEISDSIPVTLTTTKAQEVYFYMRANYADQRLLQLDENFNRDMHPDDIDDSPFARPECQALFRKLPELKPSTLYIFGNQSEASTPKLRHEKMQLTGIGIGGSGGAAEGKVQEAVLECGHLAVMERPTECADAAVSFIDRELSRWESEEEERKRRSQSLSRRERVSINDKWLQKVEELSKQGESGSKTAKSKF